jgi:NADH-quinone oxidoreductase subunit N
VADPNALTIGFREAVSRAADSMGHFIPETILVVGLIAILLADLLLPKQKSRSLFLPALGVVFAAMVALAPIFRESKSLFEGMIVVDPFSSFFKAFILLGTAIVILMSYLHGPFKGARMGEYYSILLASVLGMFLMVSATDLLMVYLAIELVSIASFVLVVYVRQSKAGSEASLKYAVYSAVASGLMIYGISLFYGLTGSTKMADVTRVLAQSTDSASMAIAAMLVLAGFAYKMAAFPMHFWAPDVYEGAPTPITAFLSVASEAAGFAVFIRFVAAFKPGHDVLTASGDRVTIDWVTLLGLLSAVTMTLGNLAALFQKNIKRLLAYSSIAHAGYILMGIACVNTTGPEGWKAVAFYLLAYAFMNLGAFAVVILVANQLQTEDVDGYRGLIHKSPVLVIALTIFLVSLIGIPPTAGFTGKLQLFMAAIDQHLIWLAVVMALNTAVSAYYYFRIIKAMTLEDAPDELPMSVPALGVALVALLVVPVIALGTFFDRIVDLTHSLRLF